MKSKLQWLHSHDKPHGFADLIVRMVFDGAELQEALNELHPHVAESLAAAEKGGKVSDKLMVLATIAMKMEAMEIKARAE